MAKFYNKWFGNSNQTPINTPTITNDTYLAGFKTSIDSIKNLWGDSLGYNVTKGGTISEEQAFKSIAVCRCIHLIASKVASAELKEYSIKKNGEKNLLNGNLDMLLNITPDEFQTSYQMFYHTVVDALLDGTGYIQLIRENNSDVARMEFHQSNTVTPLVDGRKRVKAYSVLGLTEKIPFGDMVTIKNINRNSFEGVGALETLATEINITVQGKELINNFFNNGLKTEGFFTTTTDLNPKQQEEIKTKIGEVGKEDVKIPFLPFGMKYERKASSPEEAKVVQTMKDTAEQICSFFGVPLSYIVQVDSTKIGSLEDRNSEFINDTIFPFLDGIEKELRFKIYTRLNRSKREIKYNRFPLFRTDFSTTKEFVGTMIEKGIFDINEAREMIGMDKIKNGEIRTKQLNSISLDIFDEYSQTMLINAKTKMDNKEKQFENPNEIIDNQNITTNKDGN